MQHSLFCRGMVILLFFLAACKEEKQPAAMPLPEVKVVTAVQRTLPVYAEYVGQTLGEADIEIQSRVDGWITGIYFKEGDRVEKGQLLYTIDDLPIQNRVDQAEARLAQANTQKVRAKSELDRVEPLAAMKALSQRDLDAAVANYKATSSEVDAAAAALRNAKIELDYSRIKAPISGIIGLSKKLVGDYVSRLGAGASLNIISSTKDIRVRFSISEDEYLKFARREINKDHKILEVEPISVQLILSDGSVYDAPGTIHLANRQVDPSTGSLLIQAVFPNASGLLRPGQYVKARFQTETLTDAVIVPQQAVNQMQNLYQVFVVSPEKTLTPRLVKTGKRVGSNWVITEGLKAGEQVAVMGNALLKPNTKIKTAELKWNYDSTSR